jgi:hypothetical protein
MLSCCFHAVNWDFENCDKEMNDAAENGYRRTGVNDPKIKYWTVVKGSVDLVGDGFLDVGHGNYCIDLNGGESGAIEQVGTFRGRALAAAKCVVLARRKDAGPVLFAALPARFSLISDPTAAYKPLFGPVTRAG